MTATQTKTTAPAANSPEEAKVFKWKVVDTLATRGARTHEFIVNGKSKLFTFPDQVTPVEVDMDIALRFLQVDTFAVFDHTGKEIVNKAVAGDNDEDSQYLQVDECVAKYTELTHEALLFRAKQAGGAFNKSSAKDDLISYLISETKKDLPIDGEDDLIDFSAN